jgi:hypothetical protein
MLPSPAQLPHATAAAAAGGSSEADAASGHADQSTTSSTHALGEALGASAALSTSVVGCGRALVGVWRRALLALKDACDLPHYDTVKASCEALQVKRANHEAIVSTSLCLS